MTRTSVRIGLVKVGLACLAMVGSFVLAEAIKPTHHWADILGNPRYADIIPEQFGEWESIKQPTTTVVNPVQEQRLLELYTETLARGYIHKPTGRVLMLSIAYGKDQSTDTQIHTPDACYPSQGFKVTERTEVDIRAPNVDIPAVRLMTRLGNTRTEPLTYFIRVGDILARGSKERNLARIEMALRGYLIDGLLVRVSEITTNPDSYDLQEKFLKDMAKAIDKSQASMVFGRMSTAAAQRG